MQWENQDQNFIGQIIYFFSSQQINCKEKYGGEVNTDD